MKQDGKRLLIQCGCKQPVSIAKLLSDFFCDGVLITHTHTLMHSLYFNLLDNVKSRES